jgi:hypothetical protein
MKKTYLKTFNMLTSVILNEFELVISDNGLKYNRYIGEGYTINFIVSKDEIDIFRILRLNSSEFYKGFSSLYDLFDYIVESPYFSRDLYINCPDTIKSKELQERFKLFQEYLIKKRIKKTFNFSKNKNIYHRYIHEAVGGTNVANRVKLYSKLIASKKECRNKFNGHVILRHCKEFKPGPLLRDAMEAYRKTVQDKSKEPFHVYINKLKPEEVIIDFKNVITGLPF